MTVDMIGWYIATLHQLVGHDTAERFIGQPPGPKDECVLCRYEQQPTPDNRQAVERAIGQAQEASRG